MTVKNLSVERFYHGIHAENCRALRLERNRVRNTHELAGPNIFWMCGWAALTHMAAAFSWRVWPMAFWRATTPNTNKTAF